ncbi:Hypothetical predicted protein [Cloeon dipterum]|uniref:Kelch-like protein diablo n=1 Tax=Cloeon dipterum TaxID=197152 RepID=A0A8S1CU71_9INSE|nr:Hypothetical predicted protein [Cloeon dipterum]
MVSTRATIFASLFDLYLNGTNCDLVLLSSDDVRFQVHSIVAAASFPTVRHEIEQKKRTGFLSCLNVKKARKKETIVLKKIHSVELNLLVRFAYTGDCQLHAIDSEDLVDLLRASIELRVDELADQIRNRFHQRLTPSVALKLFHQGRKNAGFEDAFLVAEEYLLRHLVQFQPADLQDVELEDLMTFLKDDRLNVESEEEVWRIVEAWVSKDEVKRTPAQEQLITCLRTGLVSVQLINKVLRNNTISKIVQNSVDKVKEKDKTGVFYEVRARIPHKVLVVLGGMTQEGEAGERDPVLPIEFYNKNSNSWTKVAELKLDWPRGYFACERIGNEIFLFGGFGSDSVSNKCQKVDLLTNKWTELPHMTLDSVSRCYASAVAMNGSIYIIGGQLKRAQDKTRSVERFDPDVGAWSLVPELTSARCDAAFVNLNGWLYVLGGFDGLIVHSSIEKLGPDGKVWTFGPRMVRQRSGLGAVVFEGRIFVFGGYDGFQQLADGEALDPELGAWSLLAPMVTARSNFGLARSERLFYAVGGFGGPKPGHPLADVEVYDPDLNKWYQIESMSGPRAGLAAFIVESLPLALKVWDNAEGLRGCRPSEIAASENDASSLEEPILEPLPQEWLQKYQQDQNAASTPSTPLFAITEV